MSIPLSIPWTDTQTRTLSLHDALPISPAARRADPDGLQRVWRHALPVESRRSHAHRGSHQPPGRDEHEIAGTPQGVHAATRSEEHTSELQSPDHLVCRLLLEKKNNLHT